MATTTKNISLDFYNNSVVNVNAKQSDANSRFIKVTCTDYGKKVTLDKNKVSAFVRMTKTDGKTVFNDTTIQDDGTVLITVSQQMVASSGKQEVDLMILSTTDLSAEDLSSTSNIDDISGVSVISVMPFYLLVSDSTIDSSQVTSTDEYDALVQATARLKVVETNVRTAESSRVTAESTRESNENTRKSNESTRQSNENTRISNENTRKSNETARQTAETKRQDSTTGEAYRIANEKTRQNTLTEMQTAITDANTAISEIDTIVKQTQVYGTLTNPSSATTYYIPFHSEASSGNKSLLNNNGIQYYTLEGTTDANGKAQLGLGNSIASGTAGNKVGSIYMYGTSSGYTYLNTANTSASNYTITLPAASGTVALQSAITSLQETIDGLQKIYFNSSVDDSIGKDGDVLMVPIS